MQITSAVPGTRHRDPSPFDEDGFLFEPQAWTRELAQQMATVDEILLTDAHWEIITFVRDRYFRYGTMPLMRRVCRELGYGKEAVRGLFGGCRKLWQIAGLPNPGEEAKTYMD